MTKIEDTLEKLAGIGEPVFIPTFFRDPLGYYQIVAYERLSGGEIRRIPESHGRHRDRGTALSAVEAVRRELSKRGRVCPVYHPKKCGRCSHPYHGLIEGRGVETKGVRCIRYQKSDCKCVGHRL